MGRSVCNISSTTQEELEVSHRREAIFINNDHDMELWDNNQCQSAAYSQISHHKCTISQAFQKPWNFLFQHGCKCHETSIANHLYYKLIINVFWE